MDLLRDQRAEGIEKRAKTITALALAEQSRNELQEQSLSIQLLSYLLQTFTRW